MRAPAIRAGSGFDAVGVATGDNGSKMTGPARLTADLLLDAHAELAEGPVWDGRTGSLWWVDINRGAVHRTDASGSYDEIFEIGQPVGAVALRHDGGLVAAVRDGFGTLDTASGAFVLRSPVGADDPTTRFNDGKPDPSGRFWAGTLAFDERTGAGTLYRLDSDWSATSVVPGSTISNGLDGLPTSGPCTTSTRRRDGSMPSTSISSTARSKDAARSPRSHQATACPTDSPSTSRAACGWPCGAVGRSSASPPNGQHDRRVDVPVQHVTRPAFGGPDLDLLFITTARQGYGPKGPPGQPHAGGLFVCRPGVRGRPANRFAG